jgi:hypothetical protein
MSDSPPGDDASADESALSAELSRTLEEIKRLALLAEPSEELETLLQRARGLLDDLEAKLRRRPQRAAALGSVLELRGMVAGLMRLMPRK